jgi:SPP1 family predicted phage head-tail adaptor
VKLSEPLNQRITFLARAAGDDAHGQPNGAWAEVGTDPTVWARSAGVSSRDMAFAAGHVATVDAKWIVRYRADVLPAWRVQWNGDTYAIVGEPAPLAGGTEWLEIRGRKVVGS